MSQAQHAARKCQLIPGSTGGRQAAARRFVTRCWLALTAVAAAASCSPARLEPASQDVILSWLVCDECIAGERDAVRVIGDAAVPYLEGVLDSVPPHILEPLRSRLSIRWTPQLHPDSTTYVNTYLDNARSKARIRAARSLGDLNAEGALRRALRTAEDREYGAEVIGVLRGEFAAIQDSASAVNTITVSPATYTMQVGESEQLAVFVEDAFGNAQVADDVTWSSSDATVAGVAYPGLVNAESVGTATITARSTVDTTVSGSALITVVAALAPAAYTIQDSTGNRQEAPAGTLLPDTLRVVVRDAGDLPASGIAVTWSVLVGGGTVTPIEAGGGGRGGGTPGVTNAAGVAAATYVVGPPGPQRVEARIAGSPAVVFRANAT